MTEADLDTVYEMHRDAYNYRPSRDWMEKFEAMSEEDQRAEMNRMQASIERNIREEEELEEARLEAFEKEVADTIALGARDRATAIRWLQQADGEEDTDAFLFHRGVSMRAAYLIQQQIGFSYVALDRSIAA